MGFCHTHSTERTCIMKGNYEDVNSDLVVCFVCWLCSLWFVSELCVCVGKRVFALEIVA